MNRAIFNIDYLAILVFVFGTERFSFGQGATDISLRKARLNRKIMHERFNFRGLSDPDPKSRVDKLMSWVIRFPIFLLL